MHIIPCEAPIGPVEAAPITSLAIHMERPGDRLDAFWTTEDDYLVRAVGTDGVQWFRIDLGLARIDPAEQAATEAKKAALGALMADIIPLGGHTVAFPVGSTGRRVYRVWRGANGGAGSRTKILGVRAGRSRRLPA